jgi:hypothetical protein
MATQAGLQLEYVPEGDDVNSWTRMMTVSIYVIPKDHTQHSDAISDLAGQMTKAYGKGKIVKQNLYHDPENPRLFIEYEVGEGLQKEHAAGVLMSTGDTAASFIQIQSRGVDFDESDSTKMQALAEGKLKLN